MGEQSDPNVERTLGHVEPTMGGVVTKIYVIQLLSLHWHQAHWWLLGLFHESSMGLEFG